MNWFHTVERLRKIDDEIIGDNRTLTFPSKIILDAQATLTETTQHIRRWNSDIKTTFFIKKDNFFPSSPSFQILGQPGMKCKMEGRQANGEEMVSVSFSAFMDKQNTYSSEDYVDQVVLGMLDPFIGPEWPE